MEGENTKCVVSGLLAIGGVRTWFVFGSEPEQPVTASFQRDCVFFFVCALGT